MQTGPTTGTVSIPPTVPNTCSHLYSYELQYHEAIISQCTHNGLLVTDVAPQVADSRFSADTAKYGSARNVSVLKWQPFTKTHPAEVSSG